MTTDFGEENIYFASSNSHKRNKEPFMSNSPNLFSYATSELSQDAFLCWLLDWANPENISFDEKLHKVAVKFVQTLLGDNELEIQSVEVKKQCRNVDVFAVVNKTLGIVIEDKIHSAPHDNQLQRYRKIDFPNVDVENISYVYLKTGNDSLRTLRYVENSGYSIVSRKDLIDILDKSKSENVILKDFLQNLWGIENRTNAFKAQPFSEWNEIPEAVQGFYLELERRLENANGGYVSNPTGGFWGLWWGFVSKASCRVYLQMENGHVRIKAECPDRGKSAEIKAIKEKFVYPWLEAEQRFRQGKFLTLAKVKDEFIYENGIVNIDEVVSKLRSLEDLLKAL